MPIDLDSLPTSIVDDPVSEKGIVKVDTHKDKESENLYTEFRAFLKSCNDIFKDSLTEAKMKECFAEDLQVLGTDKNNKAFRSKNLKEYYKKLKELRKNHKYNEVFNDEIGSWIFQYRKDSPWYYVFYDGHQLFDGAYYKVEKIALIKRDNKSFKIHRDRILSQEYDLSKSPARSFVEFVHANELIGHQTFIELKRDKSDFKYEIYCEYLKGIEKRRGTLSSEGWLKSSQATFNYCTNGYGKDDLCYDYDVYFVMQPKSNKIKSVKGYFRQIAKHTKKVNVHINVKDLESLKKAQNTIGGDSLKPLFSKPIPKELLAPVNWGA